MLYVQIYDARTAEKHYVRPNEPAFFEAMEGCLLTIREVFWQHNIPFAKTEIADNDKTLEVIFPTSYLVQMNFLKGERAFGTANQFAFKCGNSVTAAQKLINRALQINNVRSDCDSFNDVHYIKTIFDLDFV